MILFYQSILDTKRISHLPGSAHFTIPLIVKTEEWDLKVLFFKYWNSLLLGLVHTYFLQVGAYVSLKWAATGLWEGRFGWIWLKILFVLNMKTEWDLTNLLFNLWNGLALGSLQTFFLEFGAYLSLKRAITGF